MKRIKNFRNFITSSLNEEQVKPAGETEIDDGSDKELEKKVKDYTERETDKCPRCGEHTDDCICNSSDYWSTQNYHRAPKGEYKKAKPKQKFKK